MKLNVVIVVFLAAFASVCGASSKPCPFDSQALRFKGSPVEQAECLLRPVRQWGVIGDERKLPGVLSSRIGERVTLDMAMLAGYIRGLKITEMHVGGQLDEQLSFATDIAGSAVTARYFVIHDTSTPNYGKSPFPPNIDSSEWDGNRLAIWNAGENSVAHAFVNRVGESLSPVPFHRPLRATKFERQSLGRNDATYPHRGLFLHVELIQPRRSVKKTGSDDAEAPMPGFTSKQYDRLALIYVAASARTGFWLVPAFHSVLDAGIAGAHDDPQHFDLEKFANAVQELTEGMEQKIGG